MWSCPYTAATSTKEVLNVAYDLNVVCDGTCLERLLYWLPRKRCVRALVRHLVCFLELARDVNANVYLSFFMLLYTRNASKRTRYFEVSKRIVVCVCAEGTCIDTTPHVI